MLKVNKVRLTWKDVLDGSKVFIARSSLADAIQLTNKINYSYFTFNGGIYNTDGILIVTLSNGGKCILDND